MHRSIPLKRLNHFGNWVLDKLEQKELKVYQKLLAREKDKTHLDSVSKKDLPFPQILYPQQNMPVEWWYFTGHLQNKERRFGYELCFFKFHPQALRFWILPLNKIKNEPLLVLHFALTNKNKQKFDYVQESGINHLQRIDYDRLNLQLDHSSLNFEKGFSLSIKNKIANLSLELKPETKIIKHFSSGFAEMFPRHRTYYLSYPRLKTEGKLQINNKNYAVTGVSWFDHQKMNLLHHSPLRGWEWFSIIFNDHTELMFFVLRTKKGLTRKHLGGTFVKKDGTVINLSQKDAMIKPLSVWKSSHTGIIYPSGWKMNIPKLELEIVITPEVKDQELHDRGITPFAYWEGACKIMGTKADKKIKGQAYVELVGYDKRFFTKLFQSLVD